MYSQTKPLSELSMVDVLNLLESLNLRNYCAAFREDLVDGLTLMHFHSVKDVKDFGIVNEAEANRLLNKILEYKELNFRESLTSLTPDD
jgi:hypothetical protein